MAFEAFSTKTSYADLNIAFAADARFLPFLAKTCQSASGPIPDVHPRTLRPATDAPLPQYSSASIMVRTRRVRAGSAGSSLPKDRVGS